MKKTVLTLSMFFMVMGAGLMASEPSVNPKNETNEILTSIEISSFCKAVMQGDIDTVRRMIELGEDINRKSLGMTPAMFAARYNKVDVLKLLIDKGADLKIRSNKGFSAMKYAELSNAKEAMAVLENAIGS
ncbi:ankyrin repeat domain-containing protein [Maribacter sp. MMG018]|uniref:ankyrin repeat domain-containing protein n=1 Tax=Maribacter sp. MMG018 TaxID=2822688 RepID=UPI001B39BAE4|nr:ankyrin repeat domain-containing protein [Maribacter sp. MMG018]MBQ4916120.1 ankyrin repeat domain-containing protein [Maribacter sp. MMG018]